MPKKKPAKPSIFERQGKVDRDDEISEELEGFREHEEHDGTPDDFEAKLHSGEAETDVYTEEGREELIEDDEVSEWEEGFSRGEDEPELAHCAACGRVLSQDSSRLVEREINHITYVFCSKQCANKGLVHAKKR